MIMGYRQQGGIMLFDRPKKQIENTRLILRVEVAGGLIDQNQPGLGQQRPTDRRPLLLTLGQIGRRLFELIADAHLFGQHPGSLPDGCIQLQGLCYPKGVHNVVIDVEVVEEFKILKNKTHLGDAKLSPSTIIRVDRRKYH